MRNTLKIKEKYNYSLPYILNGYKYTLIVFCLFNRGKKMDSYVLKHTKAAVGVLLSEKSLYIAGYITLVFNQVLLRYICVQGQIISFYLELIEMRYLNFSRIYGMNIL